MTCQEILKNAIASRGMSLRAFALKVGVTASTMGDRVHSKKSMNLGAFVNYMNDLGYEVVVRDKISGKDYAVIDAELKEEVK